MKRFLSALIIVMLLMTVSLPATATDTTSSTAEGVSSTAATGETSSTPPLDNTSSGDTTGGEDTPKTPTQHFSGKTSKFKVPGSNVSLTKLDEMNFVTITSPDSELSKVGATRSVFTGGGYVFFGYDETFEVIFQMQRSKDAYSQHVKDYKRLSADEQSKMVEDVKSLIDYNTYTQTYTDAEFVNFAGMKCLKKISDPGDGSKTIELSSVKGGYSYEIMYTYNNSVTAEDIVAIEKMVNSLKVVNPIDVNQVLLYVALALILLLCAAFVVMYIRMTKLANAVGSVQEEAASDAIPEEAEALAEENVPDTEEETENMQFDDSDFAAPYKVSGEFAEEPQENEDNADDQTDSE